MKRFPSWNKHFNLKKSIHGIGRFTMETSVLAFQNAGSFNILLTWILNLKFSNLFSLIQNNINNCKLQFWKFNVIFMRKTILSRCFHGHISMFACFHHCRRSGRSFHHSEFYKHSKLKHSNVRIWLKARELGGGDDEWLFILLLY